MDQFELALQAWVRANLDITHRQMSREQARRWQRLKMKDFEAFCALAIYGFVQRRRRDSGNPVAWPDNEFADFLAEFSCKLALVLTGRCLALSLDLFERVGERVMSSILREVENSEAALMRHNRALAQ